MRNILDVPKHILDRLSHYFLTYKEKPFSDKKQKCEITHIYNKQEATEVIQCSVKDYKNRFEVNKQEFFELIGNSLK